MRRKALNSFFIITLVLTVAISTLGISKVVVLPPMQLNVDDDDREAGSIQQIEYEYANGIDIPMQLNADDDDREQGSIQPIEYANGIDIPMQLNVDDDDREWGSIQLIEYEYARKIDMLV